MFPYSFFRFPYYSYPHNYNYGVSNSRFYKKNVDNFQRDFVNNVDKFSPNCDGVRDEGRISCVLDDASSDGIDFFEIFGLKLYFDDILLVCIIFFLYNEGVKDQGLFIALILLLLS